MVETRLPKFRIEDADSNSPLTVGKVLRFDDTKTSEVLGR